MKMKLWKTLSKRTLLDRSPHLIVEEHKIQLPDGFIINDWSWVITPDFVIVPAITPEGKWLCFRQVKYAVKDVTLAPVGGYLNPEEDPMNAAERELLEETGHEAAEWIFLGKYVVDANRGKATGYLYLAQGAQKVAEISSDDLEEQEIVLMDRAEVEAAVLAGEFREMSYQTAMALSLLHVPA